MGRLQGRDLNGEIQDVAGGSDRWLRRIRAELMPREKGLCQAGGGDKQCPARRLSSPLV